MVFTNSIFSDGFGFFAIDDMWIASITTVPVPETYAMFLIGLGLMGFVGRHRKMNKTNL